MFRTLARAALLALATSTAACVSAEDPATDESEIVAGDGPEIVGSTEHQALLAAVHGKLDRALGGQPNEYIVRHLRSEDGFAFLLADVHGGTHELDWRATHFQPEIEAGTFQRMGPRGQAATFSVLLRRSSTGRWQLLDLVVGDKTGALAGDGYEGAPRTIFPPAAGARTS